ncbi:MAG TPA: PKD domain-containing protein, partial [Methanocella sp.]|nr:PKD domain-containing protein [Methanocella sp.]
PTSWLWDFGDGNTSGEQSPSHTYTLAGTYTVSLTAGNAGGSDTAAISGYIMVTDRPVFYVSPSSLAGATEDEISVDIMAQSLPHGLGEYSLNVSIPSFVNVTGVVYPPWAAANDTSQSGDSLRISAEDPGELIRDGAMDVRLATVTMMCESPGEAALALSDASMEDDDGTVSAPVMIDGNLAVYVPLVADFEASATEGIIPLTINFTDQSTGTPDPSSWLWDFGDGNTSGQRNSTHTYFAPGNFTVNLTVANQYGDDSATMLIHLTVPRPVASFTYNVSYGPAPLTVRFNDTSLGDPTAWEWDFGDGNTSTSRGPIHTYYTPNGVNPPYTVSLTVTNAAGSDTKTMTELIRVTYPLPVAGFTANRTGGEPPLAIQFMDTSTNANGWAWDFNNDETVDSRQQDPIYTYTTPGRYTVNLSVTGPGGTDYEVKQNYITVGNQTNCDLAINGTVNPSPAYIFAREPNTIKVYNIKNNGSEQSPQAEIELRASDGFVGRATVPVLAAGAQTTVAIEDTTSRSSAGSTVTYTAILDPDNAILETNESNNQRASTTKTVTYNGYKGKRYWEGGKDDATVKT